MQPFKAAQWQQRASLDFLIWTLKLPCAQVKGEPSLSASFEEMGTWGGTELSKNFLHSQLKMIFCAGGQGPAPAGEREGAALEARMWLTSRYNSWGSGPEMYSKNLLWRFWRIIPGHYSTDTHLFDALVTWNKGQKYSLAPPAHHVHSDQQLIQWISITDPLTILNLAETISLPPELPFLEAFYC